MNLRQKVLGVGCFRTMLVVLVATLFTVMGGFAPSYVGVNFAIVFFVVLNLLVYFIGFGVEQVFRSVVLAGLKAGFSRDKIIWRVLWAGLWAPLIVSSLVLLPFVFLLVLVPVLVAGSFVIMVVFHEVVCDELLEDMRDELTNAQKGEAK